MFSAFVYFREFNESKSQLVREFSNLVNSDFDRFWMTHVPNDGIAEYSIVDEHLAIFIEKMTAISIIYPNLGITCYISSEDNISNSLRYAIQYGDSYQLKKGENWVDIFGK